MRQWRPFPNDNKANASYDGVRGAIGTIHSGILP